MAIPRDQVEREAFFCLAPQKTYEREIVWLVEKTLSEKHDLYSENRHLCFVIFGLNVILFLF